MTYRAIIFNSRIPKCAGCQLFPNGVSREEALTAEDAMWKSIKDYLCLIYRQDKGHISWLRGALKWQPSSGIVYVDGVACGAVFKI